MSETVRYTGKLRPIESCDGDTLESVCERILRKEGVLDRPQLPSWCDSHAEMLNESLYDRYVVADGWVYEVVEKNRKETEFDIFNARINGDGTIDFEVMYYDGGCSFEEAIDNAVGNLFLAEEGDRE